jgi:serine/threonine protein kinase
VEEIEKFKKYCTAYTIIKTVDADFTSVALKVSNKIGDLFIAKIPKCAVYAIGGPSRDLFNREVEFLKKCNHRNLAKLVDLVEKKEDNFVALIIEYIEGFPLTEVLHQARKRNFPFPADTALTVAHSLTQAVQYLDDGNMVHRDICPDNIILKKNGEAVLIDMNAAKDLAKTLPVSYPQSRRPG